MKRIITILIAFSFTAFISNAQIKNSKTETVQVWGNCNMCKQTIEKVANKKRIVNTIWNKESKKASITYDTAKTTINEVLKRIALAGYDNIAFIAPDEAYDNLPDCCQYERPKHKTALKKETLTIQINDNQEAGLQMVYDAYFELKDALVKSDLNIATKKAEVLLNGINIIKMETLGGNHTAFMNAEADLIVHTQKIIESKDLKIQRENFANLSSIMYELIKTTKANSTIYYQHCPMYNDGIGANWLSKEANIKNPYFGNMMLTCGSVQDTIRQ